MLHQEVNHDFDLGKSPRLPGSLPGHDVGLIRMGNNSKTSQHPPPPPPPSPLPGMAICHNELVSDTKFF